MRVQGKAGLYKNLVSDLHTVEPSFLAAMHMQLLITKLSFCPSEKAGNGNGASQPRGRPEMETFHVQDKAKELIHTKKADRKPAEGV